MISFRVVIEPFTYFFWAFLLLILPLPWFVAFLTAALLHEMFHIAALMLMKKQVQQIRIGLDGIRMDVSGLSDGQELFCALAGPCAGFLLLGVRKWYPELSVVAVVQSLYNLIPIYPLDGGRVVRCGVTLLGFHNVDRLCNGIEVITYVLIFAFCTVLKLKAMALLIGGMLVGKVVFGKIPCKQRHLGVQ